MLNYVNVLFSGGWGNSAAVIDSGAPLTFANGSIARSNAAGLRVNSASPTLSGDTFQNNATAAVSLDLASDPDITGVNLSNNPINGVELDSGSLTASESWNNPDIVYWMSGNVTVPLGDTLTVAAGQIVKAPYGGENLVVNGTLSAQGTAANPIIFTSYRDDADGGNTDNDNSGASTGNNGDWGSIQFTSTSTANMLNYVNVLFSGGFGNSAAVIDSGAPLTFDNGSIARSNAVGLRVIGANPTLSGDTFQNNAGAAVSMDLASDPDITGVNLSNNPINGVELDSGSLTASESWNNPDIVYWMSGNVTVPLGDTLTVAAGQIVKAPYGGENLVVNGTLSAQGTAANPIIFTSYRDDADGGNTDNDNSGASTGNNGDWGSIQFTSTSTANMLNYVNALFSGGWGNSAAVIDSGPLTFANGSIARSNAAGLRVSAASPTLSGDTFQNNAGAAVSMDLASDPDITGVSLSKNPINGVDLDSGSLPGSESWNNPDIVYWMSGNVTVPLGDTLTVAAGQIVKAASGNQNLIVNGTLSAQGTAANPIIFTSFRDDTDGGNTDNDGSGTTVGSNGDWGSIQFGATSTADVMTSVEVLFSGGSGNAAAVIDNGASLSLTACVVANSYSAGVEAIDGANVQLVNDLIYGNHGAGILASGNALVTAINDTIDANYYGVQYSTATVTLTNDLITKNSSAGIDSQTGAAITITSCDVYGNNSNNTNYEGLTSQTGINGNINADPMYVNAGEGNYELSVGSQAIDAGTNTDAPSTNFNGTPRTAGQIDIGAW